MVNRVKCLINEKARSVREFAEKIGVKQVTLNQQISGDRKLSLDIVFLFLIRFQIFLLNGYCAAREICITQKIAYPILKPTTCRVYMKLLLEIKMNR